MRFRGGLHGLLLVGVALAPSLACTETRPGPALTHPSASAQGVPVASQTPPVTPVKAAAESRFPYELQWSPDSRHLVTWAPPSVASAAEQQAPCILRIWDVRGGDPRATLTVPCIGDGFQVRWLNDNQRLVTKVGTAISLFHLPDPKPVYELGSRLGFMGLRITADGERLVKNEELSGVEVLRTADGKRLAHTLFEPQDVMTAALELDPTGRFLAVYHAGKVLVVDAKTGALLRTVASPPLSSDGSLSWAPRGAQLWIADADGLVAVADASTGKSKVIRAGRKAPELEATLGDSSPQFSSDGKRVVLVDRDGKVSAVDLPTGKLRVLRGPSAGAQWLRPLSPDGRHVALVNEGVVELIPFDGGPTQKVVLPGPHNLEESRVLPEWSAEGRVVLAWGDGLFAVDTGGTLQRLATLNRGSYPHLSPDARYVAIDTESLTVVRTADGKTLKLRFPAGAGPLVAEGAEAEDVDAFWSRAKP